MMMSMLGSCGILHDVARSAAGLRICVPALMIACVAASCGKEGQAAPDADAQLDDGAAMHIVGTLRGYAWGGPAMALHEIWTRDGIISRWSAVDEEGRFTVQLPATHRGGICNIIVQDSGRPRNPMMGFYVIGESVELPMNQIERLNLQINVVQHGGREELVGHLIASSPNRSGCHILASYIMIGADGVAFCDLPLTALSESHASDIYLAVFRAGAKDPSAIVHLGAAELLLRKRTFDVELTWRRLRVAVSAMSEEEADQTRVHLYRNARPRCQLGQCQVPDRGYCEFLHAEPAPSVCVVGSHRLRSYSVSGGVDVLTVGEGLAPQDDLIRVRNGVVPSISGDTAGIDGAFVSIQPRGSLKMDYGRAMVAWEGIIKRGGSIEGNGFLSNSVSTLQLHAPGSFGVLGGPTKWVASDPTIHFQPMVQAAFTGLLFGDLQCEGMGIRGATMHIAGPGGRRLHSSPMDVFPFRSPVMPPGDYTFVADLGGGLLAWAEVELKSRRQEVRLQVEPCSIYQARIEGPDSSAYYIVRAAQGASCPWSWTVARAGTIFDFVGSPWREKEPVIIESLGKELRAVGAATLQVGDCQTIRVGG